MVWIVSTYWTSKPPDIPANCDYESMVRVSACFQAAPTASYACNYHIIYRPPFAAGVRNYADWVLLYKAPILHKLGNAYQLKYTG